MYQSCLSSLLLRQFLRRSTDDGVVDDNEEEGAISLRLMMKGNGRGLLARGEERECFFLIFTERHILFFVVVEKSPSERARGSDLRSE